MAEPNAPNFWVNLLKKIAAILLQRAGLRTRPATFHQHVVPHPDGWAIKGEGNSKYTAVYDYQEDAIERAKDIARNYGSDVVIHRQDGSIRDRIQPR
ncbi:MAG: DUF2188 domain-containing protein [Saprospiraceae bacterium]|nr:DUF2188 domain-containing protein [Saprospiraceae bacterium]